MTLNHVICTSYNTTELLEKQSSQSLQEKKNYLKRALISLELASNSDGKAFAIYLCPPLAILMGVIRSSFVIVNTHKVPEEAGGTQSGLLVQFDCEADEIDTVLDNMVDWISMRMEVLIPNYSTQLHSLTLLEEADLCTGACDLDDKELLNASLEFERNESLLPSSESTGEIFSKNKPSQGLKQDQIKMTNATPHLSVTDEQNSKSSPEGEENFHVSEVNTETEQNELVTRASEPLDCARTSCLNYTLPEDLPDVIEEDLIVWRGHLTRFGLSKFENFQLHAIQSVCLGRDTIVVQPTGSGKSLCFQLPSLIDRKKFVVVVSSTISLINSQIEGLKSLGIDAFSLGRAAGIESHLNHERIFSTDSKRSFPSVVFMTLEHFVNRVQ